MNEYIKQMMKQAGTDVSGKWMSVDHAEKFAQLIAQVCADIADEEKPSYLGCGYITKTKGTLIKEHFGVNE